MATSFQLLGRQMSEAIAEKMDAKALSRHRALETTMILRIKRFWLRLLRQDPISLIDRASKRVGTEQTPLTEQDIRDALRDLRHTVRFGDVEIYFANSNHAEFPVVGIYMDGTDLVVHTVITDKQQRAIMTLPALLETLQSCFGPLEWENEKDMSMRQTQVYGQCSLLKGNGVVV